MVHGFFRRLIVCGFIVSLGFAALTVKLLAIQIRDREFLVAYAGRQLRRTLPIRAKRGDILDAKGRPLAVSVDALSLYANPRATANPKKIAVALASILGGSSKDLERKLRGDRRYVWLKRKVTPEEVRNILSLNLEGVGFVKESRRFYPKRELASSLLGFVGVDENGLSGLELAYEKKLAGQMGRIRIQRDGRGRSVHPEAIPFLPPKRGSDLHITIDEVLQYIVEKELAAQVWKVGARRGIGVMVEPRTGRVLAMAEVPGFNPNIYSKYNQEIWRQAVVQEVYEPGSTFKLITAAAYLEAGGSLKKLFFAENGKFRIPGTRRTIRDHKKFGWLSAREIIVKSSNIGTYKMALEVKSERLYRTARRFGFGRPTGVGLSGETGGILRPLRKWSKTSLLAVAIGQEVGVTPIQMVMVAAAIANGGIMPSPHIVEAVERSGRIERVSDYSRAIRVVTPRVAQQLAALMRDVVTRGTGKLAEVKGYGAAGKTGTAQKFDRNSLTYSQSKFIMSFLGFVPYQNPRFALLVIIDEGRSAGGAWGSTVAAPVWKRIAWQSLRYLRVPPEGAKVLTVSGTSLLPRKSFVPRRTALREKVLNIVASVRQVLHGRPVVETNLSSQSQWGSAP